MGFYNSFGLITSSKPNFFPISFFAVLRSTPKINLAPAFLAA